jgi:hypothetical protein
MTDHETEKIYPDEVRRIADTVNLHLEVNGTDCAGQWLAFRLSDGNSDGNLYPSKDDAIRHQPNPEFCAYLCVVPTPMPYQEAEAWLRYWRNMNAITREISTNPGVNLILPHSREALN